MLFSAGIVRHPIRLSDILNLKNLKTVWGIKFIFCFPWSCKSYHAILGCDPEIVLTNRFTGFLPLTCLSSWFWCWGTIAALYLLNFVFFLLVYGLCVLFIYTLSLSILCVSQEARSLVESNQQRYDLCKWVIFENHRHCGPLFNKFMYW